jgi:hypothetical protein
MFGPLARIAALVRAAGAQVLACSPQVRVSVLPRAFWR